MSDDYTFRPDLEGRAHRDFKRAVRMDEALKPKAIMKARVENAVKKRTAPTREKLSAHIEKHKDRWTARELQKLRREDRQKHSLNRNSGPRPPRGAMPAIHSSERQLQRRAAANVNRRAEQRMHTLDKIENRMKRNLTRKQSRSR